MSIDMNHTRHAPGQAVKPCPQCGGALVDTSDGVWAHAIGVEPCGWRDEPVSVDRFSKDGVSVNTFAGAWANEDGTRRHVQVTVRGLYVQMDLQEWQALCEACAELGPACDGAEL